MKNAKLIAGVVIVTATLAGMGAMAKEKVKGHGFGMHSSGGMHGGGMHGEKMSFEALDTDGNGEITREEMQARKQSRFDDVDSNKDGKLTADELEAHAQKRTVDRVAKMIEHHDEDGDGALSMDEMPQMGRGEKMFDRVDEDGNGTISEAEFDSVRERMMKRHKRHKDNN